MLKKDSREFVHMEITRVLRNFSREFHMNFLLNLYHVKIIQIKNK